ncbi:hypothetical protein [uncultured Methylobacterium sp.]|uniref:hypothetical protein n=1 Tax=uncultured Methylobacterium sp. TaxID=157278 RepID=UPI00261AB22E|nr:hypothetical protein [uncultured Methylobacterium sp.]
MSGPQPEKSPDGFDPYGDRNDRDVRRMTPDAPATGAAVPPPPEGPAREAVDRATAALGQDEGDAA